MDRAPGLQQMIELVVGGVRSGKSRYAQTAAQAVCSTPLYVATAKADDDGEMVQRIRLHRQERGPEWKLVEEPMYLSRIIPRLSREEGVVIDCLTLWLSNWLCYGERAGWVSERREFLERLAETRARIWLVSNETGMGVIPDNRLSRDFVDESGRLHQDISSLADRVSLIMFGIPHLLKG